MLTRDTRLRLADRAVTRKIGDETAIVDIESGQYFGLDAIGTRFLELLEIEGSIGAVLPLMLREYAVAEEDLQTDLVRLSQDMIDSGLLEQS